MKLTDFATLELAHAHFDPINLSKNDAVNHDATFGVVEIMGAILADELSSIQLKVTARIFKGIAGGILDSVNMLDATSQAALDVLVADGRYTQTMRDDVESRAKVYPYKDTTQVELDAAHAALLLDIPAAPTLIGHPQLDNELDYSVVLAGKGVNYAVILDEVKPYDIKFDVFVHCDYSNTQTFDTNGLRIGYIIVKAGTTSNSITVTKALSQKIQVGFLSDKVCSYSAIVKTL